MESHLKADPASDKRPPSDQPVTIDITPKETGQLHYARVIALVSGVLVVE